MKVVVGTPLDICNEWFLPQWCEYNSKYADKLVILVDNIGKPDISKESYELLAKWNVDVSPLGFEWYESKSWKALSDRCKQYNPEWFGVVAADTVFENKFLEQAKELFNDPSSFWYSFPMYHMWGDMFHYRVDGLFGVSATMSVTHFYRNCLSDYNFGDKKYHSSHIPNGIMDKPGKRLLLKEKHCGYAKDGLGAWKQRCELRGIEYGDTNLDFGEVVVKEWIE